jgi:predicted transcriptional regulator
MTTPQAKRTALQIANAVLETVNEAGENGAPAGVMYAAFMAHGMSLAMFEAVTEALVDAGKIVKRNNCFYPVKWEANHDDRVRT